MIKLKNGKAVLKGKYPLVYVNTDGSVREINILEKLYLQTEYDGSDGDRPYIKSKYSEKNVLGNISGFCHRNKIPRTVNIQTIKDNATKNEIQTEINKIKEMGYNIDFGGIEIK